MTGSRASARLLKGGTEEQLRAVRAYETRLPRTAIEPAAPVLMLTPVKLGGDLKNVSA